MEDRHVPSDVFIPPDDVEVSPPTPQQSQQYFSPSLPSVSMKIKDDWMTTLSPQPQKFISPDDVELSPSVPPQSQWLFSQSSPSLSMKIEDDCMNTLPPWPQEFVPPNNVELPPSVPQQSQRSFPQSSPSLSVKIEDKKTTTLLCKLKCLNIPGPLQLSQMTMWTYRWIVVIMYPTQRIHMCGPHQQTYPLLWRSPSSTHCIPQ